MHTYVALLRGINVGGNNTVRMTDLKQLFETAGMQQVRTYINSGNVIFSSRQVDRRLVLSNLERALAERYEFAPRLVVVTAEQVRAIAAALPDDWLNDTTHKTDVLYLRPEIDQPTIMDQLGIKPDYETVRYVPGAVLWHVSRKQVHKGGLLKLVGTDLYQQMTIRNCNTARKLAVLATETVDL